jgi:hypothetical protein
LGFQLREVHGIALGRETLRLWMVEAGLWLDRNQRRKHVHQPRHRRDCVGELVQVDGCEHWWFEARGPQCTLLVFIDDATSRLMHLQFVESESTFAYFHAARAYLEAWGKPVAFYSDKHGVFRVNHEGAIGGDGMTQFGRALHALNIDIICANSSQAKGRVERAHKTLQDRLVKELRLAGARVLLLLYRGQSRLHPCDASRRVRRRRSTRQPRLECGAGPRHHGGRYRHLGAAFDAAADLLREAPGLPNHPTGRVEQPTIGTLQPFPVRRCFDAHRPADLEQLALYAAGSVAQLVADGANELGDPCKYHSRRRKRLGFLAQLIQVNIPNLSRDADSDGKPAIDGRALANLTRVV